MQYLIQTTVPRLLRATLAGALLACITAGNALRAQDLLWTVQVGSTWDEDPRAMAPDGTGGAFVGGSTNGDFGGPFLGTLWYDVWLGRFDASGATLWLKHFGTADKPDMLRGCAPDAAGGVFAAGETSGNIGGPGTGGLWIARFDGAGDALWFRQFGTDQVDQALALCPDGSGGAFVGGLTYGDLGGPAQDWDGWVARYDSSGNQLWIRQIGSFDYDALLALTPDGNGGCFLSGYTEGTLAGPIVGYQDAWVARYDGAGNSLWVRQFGSTSFERSTALSADGAGGVFVCGRTNGDLAGSAGSLDAWVARYDAGGSQVWIRQFGTLAADSLLHSTPDGHGGCFVGGSTTGSLGGPNQGDEDAWIGRLDSDGDILWLQQFGTSIQDVSTGSAGDGAGGVLQCGYTQSGYVYSSDVVLARYGAGCLPGVNYCTALLTSGGCVPSLSSIGVSSLSAPAAFQVVANDLEPGKIGLLYFGTTGGTWTPFFGGTLCVASPVYRLQAGNTGGSAPCSGQLVHSFADLLAHPAAGSLLEVGTQVRCQVWFRDPAALQSVGLTDGLKFTVCP